MKTDEITFDFEASLDKECAFFALYAGLRIYKRMKANHPTPSNQFSVAGAEAYCMLEQLKEQCPIQYDIAEKEFNEVYGSDKIHADMPLIQNN